MIEIQKWLRPPAAGDYLGGISLSTLAKMRLRGDGPPYHKAGLKMVLYDRVDLDAWLAARRRSSTSDLGEVAK